MVLRFKPGKEIPPRATGHPLWSASFPFWARLGKQTGSGGSFGRLLARPIGNAGPAPRLGGKSALPVRRLTGSTLAQGRPRRSSRSLPSLQTQVELAGPGH